MTTGFTFAWILITECVTFCFSTGLEISSDIIPVDRLTSGKFLAPEPEFVCVPTRICNLVRVEIIGDSVDSLRVLKEACGLVRLEKARIVIRCGSHFLVYVDCR